MSSDKANGNLSGYEENDCHKPVIVSFDVENVSAFLYTVCAGRGGEVAKGARSKEQGATPPHGCG
jgi:hypothetical protein